MGTKKKELHPALRANADKLKSGQPLSPGRKKRPPAVATKPVVKKRIRKTSATTSKKG